MAKNTTCLFIDFILENQLNSLELELEAKEADRIASLKARRDALEAHVECDNKEQMLASYDRLIKE